MFGLMENEKKKEKYKRKEKKKIRIEKRYMIYFVVWLKKNANIGMSCLEKETTYIRRDINGVYSMLQCLSTCIHIYVQYYYIFLIKLIHTYFSHYYLIQSRLIIEFEKS